MTLLQLALDFINSTAAVELLARVSPAVDIVEAGTPLIKREGIGVLALLVGLLPIAGIVVAAVGLIASTCGGSQSCPDRLRRYQSCHRSPCSRWARCSVPSPSTTRLG